jgi:hypothetical protein
MCVAVVIVCILAVGISLVAMDKNDVKEVPKALLEVANGNIHFTNSLYKVRGGCLAGANVASLLFAFEQSNVTYCGG